MLLLSSRRYCSFFIYNFRISYYLHSFTKFRFTEIILCCLLDNLNLRQKPILVSVKIFESNFWYNNWLLSASEINTDFKEVTISNKIKYITNITLKLYLILVARKQKLLRDHSRISWLYIATLFVVYFFVKNKVFE